MTRITKRKIKIVHLLYSGLGGHSSVFFSIFSANNKEVYNHVPIFIGIEEVTDAVKKKCFENNIPVIGVKKKRGIDFTFFLTIVKILKNQSADIVFMHGSGAFLPVFLHNLISLKCKIIYRDTQAHHLKTSANWIFLVLAHWFFFKTIFLTPEAKQTLSEKLGFLFFNSKTEIVPNGIDTSLYTPKDEVKESSQTLYFGMQSRLQAIKDHETLINAFCKFCNQEPDRSFKLLIAGDGDTKFLLEQQIEKLNFKDRIILTGLLDETRLIAFMHNIDIYIHATFGETFSNSILQAMACQLPVIASNVWGVNNLITDCETGLLFESKNVESLVAKMTLLANDKILAKSLAFNALKIVEKKYSSEIMFENYNAIFKQIS